jgi:hypothetical protein
MKQAHAVLDTELVQTVDRRKHRDCPVADDQLVMRQPGFAAVLLAQCEWSAGDVDRGGEGVRAQFMPVASRSARVRRARLDQWVTSPVT